MTCADHIINSVLSIYSNTLLASLSSPTAASLFEKIFPLSVSMLRQLCFKTEQVKRSTFPKAARRLNCKCVALSGTCQYLYLLFSIYGIIDL